jgi:HTH-type transcriptional regulator, glycine betaine synthesis regulator
MNLKLIMIGQFELNRDATVEPVAAVAEYFGQLAPAVGLPRTVGRIYGVLFLSKVPMTFNEVVQGAGISKASTSTGLRILSRLRAVVLVSGVGERRLSYAAETSARRLLGGLLSGSLMPHLEAGEELLEGLDAKDDFVAGRLESLRSWQRSAREMLPVLGRYGLP